MKIKIQEKAKTQSMESNDYDKIIQELIDEMAIVRRKPTDLRSKKTLQNFHNAIPSINSKTDQPEERITELEDWFSELSWTKKIFFFLI